MTAACAEPPRRHGWSAAALAEIRAGAAEIDATFAVTGARFAEGLELFEGLKNRLIALSSEMSHPDLAAARDALAALAQEMPALEDLLGREKAALADLAELSLAVGRMFTDLRASMRLVCILTQRARIERAGIRSHGHDLESYSDEIVALAQSARQVIEECARRHDDAAVLISKAASVQNAFERRFGRSLTGLAGELGGMLGALAERHARSAEAVEHMADHSRKVVAATGAAVMALQGGDSVRQRLEHSIVTLDLAEHGAAGLRAAVSALVAAQLRAAAGQMEDDCGQVNAAVATLGKSTDRLVAAVQESTGDGKANASPSIVADLQAGLVRAAALLRECEADRSIVDDGMARLVAVLENIEATVASLRKSAVDIGFLGTNAGLRASRLGESGRSLLVIARELNAAAGLVEARSVELLGALPRLLASASALRDGSRGAADLAIFEATVQRSMTVIGKSDERMAELLRSLQEEAGLFVVEVASAQRSFSAMARRCESLRAVADDLEDEADKRCRELDPATARDAAALLRDRVFPLYSMAAEREIHRRVAAALGLIDEPSGAPPAMVVDAEDSFELL